ncbi:MAG TPA: AsmA family protein [Steroidobacteraceae bacterium]|nr:AsmA family protein [Steroidobacteraceae bacterium]
MLMDTHRASKPWRVGRGVALAAAVLLIALVWFMALFDWNHLRGAISGLASAHLHRQVRMDHLSVRVWQRNPSVAIEHLSVSNPSWAAGNMVEVGQLTFAIEPWPLLRGRLVLARLQIDRPQVVLLRDSGNRANWDFSDDQMKKKQADKPGPPAQLPVIHRFTLNGGTLKVDDAIRKLRFDGTLSANEGATRALSHAFELKGQGQLNGKAFELTFGGSSLFNLQLDEPYDYDAEIHAGPLQATARGVIDKPFDLGHLSANLDFKGENLAALYYLTGLALPFTPPFHLSGELRRDGMMYRLRKLQGTVGDSDLHGELSVEAAGTRPRLTAELISHALDLADLAPSVGAGVPNDNTDAKSDTQAPRAQADDKLLPTYQFDFDRLRSMDASVELRADSVKTQKVPITGVNLKLNLERGVLTLDPADLTLPQGKLGGAIRINAQNAVADTSIDLRLSNVNLSELKSAKMSEAPLDGDLLSRVLLEGSGNSVHEIFASSHGEIVAVIPHGEMRQAFAELTGINAARALGLLLTGSRKEDGIRCGIAAFSVDHGKATAEPLVFDTDTVAVTGSGGFDFNTEDLDLRLKGQSKKFEPLHVRAPITVRGTLGKPSIGLDPKSLAAQGGAAAALGVLATPLAAVAAFIDPGLAKNQDCSRLLSSAPEKAAEQPGAPQLAPK